VRLPDWIPTVDPSIVLLGNLLVDDVVLSGGTTRIGQPGGALLYGARLAAPCGGRAPDWSASRVMITLRRCSRPFSSVASISAASITWVGPYGTDEFGFYWRSTGPQPRNDALTTRPHSRPHGRGQRAGQRGVDAS